GEIVEDVRDLPLFGRAHARPPKERSIFASEVVASPSARVCCRVRTRKRDTRGGARRAASRASRRRGWGWGAGLGMAITALAGVLWWRLSAPPPAARIGGPGLLLDPEEADRTALTLGREGRHLESIPYFREVVKQRPLSGIAH